MATGIPRVLAQDPPERLLKGLEESGAVIVEGLLGPDLLARLNAELDPWVDASAEAPPCVNPGVEWFMGAQTRHLTGLAAKSRSFASEVLCHPLLLSVCDAILLPSCARYQLNVAHLLDRGPGSELQLLHRDQLVWNDVPKPHPELQLASVIALVDVDAENGATRVIPGSHRWPLERVPDESETVTAEMSAGDAVVYLGSTLHGGGANTTADKRRRAMHLSYVLGWLRTEENHYLAVPPDVARDLPRVAQELLGYAAHDALARGGGYLGTVDIQDPIELLEQGTL